MLAYLHEALTPSEMEIKLSVKPPVFSPSWEGDRLFLTYRHKQPFIIEVHRQHVPNAFAWQRIQGISYYLTLHSEPEIWTMQHRKAQKRAITYLINQVMTHGHPQPPEAGREGS